MQRLLTAYHLLVAKAPLSKPARAHFSKCLAHSTAPPPNSRRLVRLRLGSPKAHLNQSSAPLTPTPQAPFPSHTPTAQRSRQRRGVSVQHHCKRTQPCFFAATVPRGAQPRPLHAQLGHTSPCLTSLCQLLPRLIGTWFLQSRLANHAPHRLTNRQALPRPAFSLAQLCAVRNHLSLAR